MFIFEDRERYEPGMKRQLARLRSAVAGGMPRRGWKIGINVPEVLKKAGLHHPGVGWLHGDRIFESGATVSAPRESGLHVEAEICLHVASPVSASAEPQELRGCVAEVSAALELVDYALPAKNLDEIVEHSMFHEACVLGERYPLDAAAELGTKWPQLWVSGQQPPSPRSDLVPADLAQIVHFVAVFLDAFGEALRQGDLILSGSFCPVALPLEPGMEARADFGPLGEVSVKISS